MRGALGALFARGSDTHHRSLARDLFLVGFLVLFLELAAIRWFASTVVFLQFFTNVALIASFLGMSCGCLAARRKTDWLAVYPLLSLATVLAAIGILAVYNYWSGIAIDVGHQASPQQVFFGTEYRNPDVARFTVPIELVAGTFFVLIALMFVGLGQVLGRAFDAYPDRVMGYTWNIGGSLAGIVAFSGLSFLQAPPTAWFGACSLGIGFLLWQRRKLSLVRAVALVLIPIAVAAPGLQRTLEGLEVRWSPYYAVKYNPKSQSIWVNTISHQNIVRFDHRGATYSLIHLLQKHSGGAPFGNVLVIGAGSGNDLVHALRHNVGRIDAVEIDPVIQSIGRRYNTDKPYQDPRVVARLDDGRHFLRTTGEKYDLVVYALVDSLILHSGYSSIRLESYLFTQEAFEDIKRVLKPGGLFVTYNYFRQGWIVDRVAAMAEKVFGCPATVLSLPYLSELRPNDASGFTMVIAGCNPAIASALAAKGPFWLNIVPTANLGVDGFTVDPAKLAPAERESWLRIAPTKLVGAAVARSAHDDWPFLYLRDRAIPNLTVRSMLLLGALGIGLVVLFLPKRAGALGLNGRMFFLGAAFMLLETKAVVQLALLFGSTWIVNSMVFFTVLVMILLANLYVRRAPQLKLAWYYAGLLVFLAIGVITPMNGFLGGGVFWRYVVPCLLALGPMFFAGVIFARAFRDARNPDQAFGSNIAGSVVGGLAESFSMVLGFQYLLVLAIAFYLLSASGPIFGRQGRPPAGA